MKSPLEQFFKQAFEGFLKQALKDFEKDLKAGTVRRLAGASIDTYMRGAREFVLFIQGRPFLPWGSRKIRSK